MSEPVRVGIGMVVGGTVGWALGFLAMLLTADLDDWGAILWPIGGAFGGIVAGGLIGASI